MSIFAIATLQAGPSNGCNLNEEPRPSSGVWTLNSNRFESPESAYYPPEVDPVILAVLHLR